MPDLGRVVFPQAGAGRFLALHVRRGVEGVAQATLRPGTGAWGRQQAEHVQRALARGIQAKATFSTVQPMEKKAESSGDGWTTVESRATQQQKKAVERFAVKLEEKQVSKVEVKTRMTCEWNYKRDMNLGAGWARAWEEVASFQMGDVRRVIQRRARDLYDFLRQQVATITPREGKAYTRDAFLCAEPKALASFLASVGENEEWLLSSFRIKNIRFGDHPTPPCPVCSTWLEADPYRGGTYRIQPALLGF